MISRQLEKAEFPENNMCSSLVCSNGHTWPLTLQLVGCEGCGGVVVAVKAELCPVCNEPFAELKLRTDVTTPVMGIPQSCQGQFGRGISSILSINYADWKDWQVLHYSVPEIVDGSGSSKLYDHAKAANEESNE